MPWVPRLVGELRRVNEAEECGLPWIPCEQPVDQSASAADDLRRDENEGLEEGSEVHADDRLSLLFMALSPPWADWETHPDPRLEGPTERRHHHEGPVGQERVDRGVECANAVLELLDEVLLVAAIVSLLNGGMPRSSGSVAS